MTKKLTVTLHYEVVVDPAHADVQSYNSIDEMLSIKIENNFNGNPSQLDGGAIKVVSTDVFDYDILN